MSLGFEMDDGNRNGTRRIRNGVRCLLLRRSRRRAHSEPPTGKGKRHERHRDASFSPKTTKPRKIARDERYKTSRNSTSDSGFLSLESNGIELTDMTGNERISKVENTENTVGTSSNYDYGTFTTSGTVSDDELIMTSSMIRQHREFSSPFNTESVDLNENFDSISYEKDQETYSVDSSSLCFRCTCLPRIFGRRTRSRSRVNRRDSFQSQERSTVASSGYYDFREDKLLKYLRDNDTSSNTSDDTRCFLNVLYTEHKCGDSSKCNQQKCSSSLNAHLRNLIDCMPKSFCDCESNTTSWENSEPERAGYLSHRRNAVCETSKETRTKFYEALCTFMTLKALVRYDLL